MNTLSPLHGRRSVFAIDFPHAAIEGINCRAVIGHAGWSHWHATSTPSLPARRHNSLQNSSSIGTAKKRTIRAHIFFFLLHQQSGPSSFAGNSGADASLIARRSPNLALPFQEGFSTHSRAASAKMTVNLSTIDRGRPHFDSRFPADRLSRVPAKRPFGRSTALEELRSLVKGDSAMANKTPKKCAHIPCRCEVTNGNKYCGQACQDAGSDEVEIACDCSHPAAAISPSLPWR